MYRNIIVLASKTVSKHADLKEPACIEQGFKRIPARKFFNDRRKWQHERKPVLKVQKQEIKRVGLAHKKYASKVDMIVKVNIQSPFAPFYTTILSCEDAGRGLCILTFTFISYLFCLHISVCQSYLFRYTLFDPLQEVCNNDTEHLPMT